MKSIPPDRTLTLPLFLRVSQRRVSPAGLGLLLASVLSAACVRHLPPAPTPAPVIPRVDGPPPPENTARLVIDVVDGSAPVQRIRLTPEPMDNGQGRVTFRFVETPEPLCASTPCVADIPRGNHLLGFPVLGQPSALDVALVHVGPEPSVYRRALTYRSRPGALRVLGIIGASLGGTAVMTGASLLPIGLAKDISGLTVAGGISLGAGAAILTLGILAIRADPAIYRAGASNHYPLTP